MNTLSRIFAHPLLPVALVTAAVALVDPLRADEATEWNQIMVDTIRAAGMGGINAARPAATVQAAVFDAVNGIEARYGWIHVQPAAPAGASRRAAAVQAASASLIKLFPAQSGNLSSKRAASLAAIASSDAAENSESIQRGVAWGQLVADAIVAWRNADGFTPAPPPNTGGTADGQWRPTPPANLPFAVVQLGFTTPWLIPSAAYFPLAGPPSLASARYASDLNEVRLLGRDTSLTRTAAQTQIARFWASPSSPTFIWNRVAVAFGAQRHTTLSENARILALVNVAIADAGIACWRAKYDYMFWRPITAIRVADGNNDWTPLLTTPPYPDYPSGLCSLSSAALAVLADYFGENSPFVVDSDAPAMAGVVRLFTSFGAAARELVDARVYGGLHFRFADEDAIKLGAEVAQYILANACLPMHGNRKGQLK